MEFIWNWVEPSFGQWAIVNVGFFLLSMLIMLIAVHLINNKKINENDLIAMFIPVFALGLYIITINIRSIYLIIDNGVEGTDWLLLVLYIVPIFQIPSFKVTTTRTI